LETFAIFTIYLGNGGPWLLWMSRKSQIDLCRLRWPWVTLKGRTSGVKFFRRSVITLSAVWSGTTTFGKGTHAGWEVFLWDQLQPSLVSFTKYIGQKFQIFPTQHFFMPPQRGFPLKLGNIGWVHETRIRSEKSLMIFFSD